MAHLEILAGPNGCRQVPLDDEVILGRSRDNRVCLTDAYVSRRHARVSRQGTDYVIEDLHSTNGIFLHGSRLSPGKPYRLENGDEIRICNTRLFFHADQPTPQHPQPDDPKQQPVAKVETPVAVTVQSDVEPAALKILGDNNSQPNIAVVLDASVNMLEIDSDAEQTSKGWQEAVTRLQAICKVSTALIAIVDRETLLKRVLDYIFEMFPAADRSFILLQKQDSNTLVPVATKIRQPLPGHQQEIAISHTVINEVLTHKHAILSLDAVDDEHFDQGESVVSLSIRSMMYAPLLVRGEILGLIQVDTVKNKEAFTSEDLRLLTGIAAQAALAVKNSQLNELEEHLRVVTIINRIGVALSTEKDTDRLLAMIVEGARSITNADGRALYIVTADQQLQLSTMHIDSLNLDLDRSTESPILLYSNDGTPNTSSIAAYSVLKASTINIPDIYAAEDFDLSENYRFDQERDYRSQSFLSVPMTNHEREIIGVLQLINAQDKFSQEIVPFSDQDQRLAESLASQAAVGLSRNKLLEALEESEKRYRDLVENNPGAICIHDLDGALLFVNQAWAQSLGYQPTDLVGRNLHDLLTSSVQHLLGEYLESVRQESVANGLARLLTRDGEERLWSYRSLRYEEAGKPPYVFTHAQDITEYKRLEAHLRQTQKMEAIGTLAGGVAHDFNNILSAILGYTELTMEDMSKDSQSWKHLERVLKAGKRARDLVQQILAFSRRDEAGRKPVDLHLIVEEELKLLRASLPTTIDIHQHIDPLSGAVLADPTQMHQVILNLCTNAEHAMRETGGILEVCLEASDVTVDLTEAHPQLTVGPYLHLTIRDTGHGMAPEVVERIFEPFFTTKGTGEGTGMGLAMVHGIVANHGGTIIVESQEGQGTSFEVYLPRIVEAAGANEDTQASMVLRVPPKKKRVLVVDDEEPLANLVRMMLERMGYETVCNTDSVEALEIFRKNPDNFDLVITDQTMPSMTGESLARELRDIRPSIPIILCTGFSHTMTEEKSQALGINAFLMKPLTPRDLERVVRKILE